jgi:hypothetical protein
MGYPTVTKTWTASPNNRYRFPVGSGTVLGCMQAFAFSIKTFLKVTMGYSLKGSCSAGTGAMDGVDRWNSASDVTPRNSGAGGSQAWVVLTDGNGVDICFSFNSSSDDVFRLAFSPGGLYVAAATPNQQPTATDEVPVWNNAAITWVGVTASRDRVWHLLGSSDKRMFRCVLYRLSLPICTIGVEQITSSVVSPSTFSPAVWGWAYMNDPRFSGSVGGLMSQGQSPPVNGGGGIARVTTPGGGTKNAVIGGGGRHFASIGGPTTASFTVARPELQGGTGLVWVPLTGVSETANACGKLGTRIDCWAVYTPTPTGLPSQGEQFFDRGFISIGGMVVPWDGITGAVVR